MIASRIVAHTFSRRANRVADKEWRDDIDEVHRFLLAQRLMRLRFVAPVICLLTRTFVPSTGINSTALTSTERSSIVPTSMNGTGESTTEMLLPIVPSGIQSGAIAGIIIG